MKRYIAAAMISLMCSLITPAQAAEDLDYTAIELMDMCQSSYDTDYGYCAGYVLAISNALTATTIDGYRACGHAPVKSQQLIEIYVSYLARNPQAKQKSAMSSVAASIASSFPCR